MQINKIISILKKHYKIKHKKTSPFNVLISCLLSTRTKDQTTEKATKNLFSIANTPKKILSLPIKKIEKLIYPVGFYKTKAKNIKKICKTLIKNYNSKVPDNFNELLKLNGIGRKCASITLLYGHKKTNYLPIDTHCHRVPNRIGWINTKNVEKTEEELKKILPKNYWYNFNYLFVAFSQNICRLIKPHCWECPISKYCKHYHKVYLKQIKK